MARTGRPRAAEPRDRMVNVRLTAQEFELLMSVALRSGVPVSRYVRAAALEAARLAEG